MAYDFLLLQGTTTELSQQHKKQLGLGAGVGVPSLPANHWGQPQVVFWQLFYNVQYSEAAGWEENSCHWDSKGLSLCQASSTV